MLFKRFGILFIFPALLSQIHAQPVERGLIVKKDSAGTNGITYALIIGISQYKSVPSLQFAHKDALAFENFLISEVGGKVPKINIETFLNENATRNNVADAISIIARKAKPGDRVYFFFAGHGDMEDLTQIENGLLLLYNCPNGNYFGMKDDVLEILDLKRYLSPLAQRGVEMIFIVDACHAGNLKGGVEGVQQTASALAASWGKEYKILSCQPNQLSLESDEWGGGRGLFSLELEEGMKGLADANSDGKISMFELQSYIQTNVAKYSEGKQIPLVSGDLSKIFINVNPNVLAALKIQKAKDRPALAMVNPKGMEEKYIDSLDPAGRKIYLSYKKNLADRKLIWPKDTNALKDYKAFVKKYPENELTPLMRRNLAAALNQRFDSIVSPLLRGAISYSSRDECYYAAAELDSCMHLLGEQHYMYANLKARKLYMDAMALTWALSENECNISLKPDIDSSIRLLEESEALEPNAAYTMVALGERYFFVYEYEKAFLKFQKYLDLRPNDFYARYSLGNLYLKLKQYEKAQTILSDLVKRYPAYTELYRLLSEAYYNNNKPDAARDCIRQILEVAKDTGNYYFYKGIYYARFNQPDSAIFYYRLAKQKVGECPICENNIGHMYMVHNNLDSARFYFNQLLAKDSTDPFPNFNLGTISILEDDYSKAINSFINTIKYSTGTREGYVTRLDIYFNKKYNIADSSRYREFAEKISVFNMQYMSWLSILYCYLRDEKLQLKTDKLEYIFTWLFNYKEYDVLTWYHHACWKALQKDKTSALESLGKALKLGFGNYFQITSDADLNFIRGTPEFKALQETYFPYEKKKN